MRRTDGVIVQSVSRALDIIQCFSGNTVELGISEISDRMQLNKSTIYGLVNTLTVKGYLEQNSQTKKYRLGIKLFEFGVLVQKRMDLRNEASPFCQKLQEKYADTVHLATHYKGEVVYIDKIAAPNSMISYSQVGKRAPMYCTGVGKAILAYVGKEYLDQFILKETFDAMTEKTITTSEKLLKELEHIKDKGYAIDNEEIEIGLRCVAAPIFNYKGYPIAAISVSAPYKKMTDEMIEKISQDVKYYAQKISERMGYLIS